MDHSAMDHPAIPAREVSAGDDRFAYSFCTLVNDLDEYRLMREAFVRKGFSPADCEYLYIDNAGRNAFDAFEGCNRMLARATGRHIVLCHQDVAPIDDDRPRLDALIDGLYREDPHWAVCGNAGVDRHDRPATRITDAWGPDQNVGGPFPARVMSVDENFVVVRRDANLCLSRDLGGYHWYGADLCIIAETLGWTSYVIDFHLRHRSGGNKGEAFHSAKARFLDKYNGAFRARWHHVPTRESVYLSGSPALTSLQMRAHFIRSNAAKALKKIRSRIA